MWNLDEDTYCPHCGEKGTVWWTDDGDVEVGGDHVCLVCSAVFQLPCGIRSDPSRVAAVRRWLCGDG